MAKYQQKTNPKVIEIFEQLEQFKEVCVENGYVFNEAHLGDMNSFPYRQFQRVSSGKTSRNCWEEDAAKYEHLQQKNAQFY